MDASATSNPAISLDPTSQTRELDSVDLAELAPPSALLASMLEQARGLSAGDRRALLEELGRALTAEGIKAAG